MRTPDQTGIERKGGGRFRLFAVYGTIVLLAGTAFLSLDVYLGYHRLLTQIEATTIRDTFIPDDRLGWRPKPGSVGYNLSPGNFEVNYRIDSQGFKAVPFRARPELRIYFFGDSYTFGHGVGNDDTFPNIIADKHLKPKVEVINAGVTGYGLIQMLLRLYELEDQLNPGDIIVFSPTSWNLRRNLEEFAFVGQFIFMKRQLSVSYFPYITGGEIKSAPLDTPVNRLKTLLFYARFTGKISHRLYRVITRPDSLAQAKEIINSARELAAGKGTRFMLTFLPTYEECLRGRYGVDVSSLDYFDLLPHFPSRKEELDRIVFPGDSHWNSRGHAQAAKAIVSALREERLLEKRYVLENNEIK